MEDGRGDREEMEPGAAQRAEDEDSARLVARFQAGDNEAYGTLYVRYFDRVYTYLKTIFHNHHDSEDIAQDVFLKALEALPRYEQRRQPFRAWLFVVVRNTALQELEKRNRLEVMDPEEIGRLKERAAAAEGLSPDDPAVKVLGWLTDTDLVTFVERLPLPQRQVLVLRFLLDLTAAESARILGRSRTDISTLQHRALTFLEDRLRALGREPKGGPLSEMQRWGTPMNVIRSRRFSL